MYRTQVIVTSELSPAENLYLRCLTNQLTKEDAPLVEELVKDYRENQEQTEYLKYMNYLAKANTKGESPMVCEGILELCGTSSKEIANRQKKEDAAYYEPIIQQQKEEFQQQKKRMLPCKKCTLSDCNKSIFFNNSESRPDTRLAFTIF